MKTPEVWIKDCTKPAEGENLVSSSFINLRFFDRVLLVLAVVLVAIVLWPQDSRAGEDLHFSPDEVLVQCWPTDKGTILQLKTEFGERELSHPQMSWEMEIPCRRNGYVPESYLKNQTRDGFWQFFDPL